MDREDELLAEEVAGAWRPRDPRELKFHPFWYDLDEEGRIEAHDRSVRQRELESALDPEGLNSTVHAVLSRIREAR